MKSLLLKVGVGAVLLGALFGAVTTCNSYKGKYEQQAALYKDYETVVNTTNLENRQLQMTNAQLSASKDSINQLLVEARKNMGIKEKKVKEYVYLKETVHDTIALSVPDSVFIQDFDTTLVLNDYTKMGIKVDAPYMISIAPDIASEKILIFSYKKEYVNTPSKIFFIRWFQKKREVVVVDIQESNPLIKVEQSRFINVISK